MSERAYNASKVLPLPGSQDSIVLLDPGANPGEQFRNVIRLATDNQVIWVAELADRYDSCDRYMNIEWVDGKLTASTWSGHSVELDTHTGRIRTQTFTK
jgi:outer membrane protein assembly factor BamB